MQDFNLAEPPKQSDDQIHHSLDRQARLLLGFLVYFIVGIYVLIRIQIDLPEILRPVFDSTVVGVFLLKGGIATAYVLFLVTGYLTPSEKPTRPINGRSTFEHYLAKHARVLALAPVIILVLEAFIDIFYIF